MGKKKLFKYIGLFLILLFLAGCSQKVAKRQAGNQVKQLIKVKTQKIIPSKFVTQIILTSETKPKRDLNLSAPIGGIIEWMGFDVGDYVQKGGVLAKIDSRMLRAQLEASRATYDASQSNYLRQKSLYNKKLISAQAFETAKAQFESASARLSIAEVNYENSRISAPVDGYIAHKFMDMGEMASPGMPIYNLVNINVIKIIVGVSQEDLPKIKKQIVKVRIPSMNKIYWGKIVSIGSKANEKSKTFPVQIEVNNFNRQIKAGVIADVYIPLKSYKKAIVVRYDYLLENGPNKRVCVIVNGKAHFKNVKLGARNDVYVLVKKGLSVGDVMVIEGQHLLEEGQRVEVI